MHARNLVSAVVVALGLGLVACGEAEQVAQGHLSTFGTCGSCHAIPPDDGPVFTLGGQDKTAHIHHAITMTISCGGCHDGYGNSSVNPSLHTNGRIDVHYRQGTQYTGWNCLGCH